MSDCGYPMTPDWFAPHFEFRFPRLGDFAAKDVHVLGDSIQIAPGMPKSGHMANAQAKVAAAAIVAQLNGWEVNPNPMLTNTCYSMVDAKNCIHVASVHEYVDAEKTFKTVPGSGGRPSRVRSSRHMIFAPCGRVSILPTSNRLHQSLPSRCAAKPCIIGWPKPGSIAKDRGSATSATPCMPCRKNRLSNCAASTFGGRAVPQ